VSQDFEVGNAAPSSTDGHDRRVYPGDLDLVRKLFEYMRRVEPVDVSEMLLIEISHAAVPGIDQVANRVWRAAPRLGWPGFG
jgi:hypothetical protein